MNPFSIPSETETKFIGLSARKQDCIIVLHSNVEYTLDFSTSYIHFSDPGCTNNDNWTF